MRHMKEIQNVQNLLAKYWPPNYGTLFQDVLRNSQLPKPKDLKCAMELWTLKSLMTLLTNVSFKPSNHGLLRDVPGRRNTSFKDMVDLFFPFAECNI